MESFWKTESLSKNLFVSTESTSRFHTSMSWSLQHSGEFTSRNFAYSVVFKHILNIFLTVRASILFSWDGVKQSRKQAWHSGLSWGQHWRPQVHYLKWLFMVKQRLLASFPLPRFYLMGVQDTLARVHWCAFVICVSASNTQPLILQILVPEIIEQRPTIIWKQKQKK